MLPHYLYVSTFTVYVFGIGVNISEGKSRTKRMKKRESTPVRDELHTKVPSSICWYRSTTRI